jgi:hypothetical protein
MANISLSSVFAVNNSIKAKPSKRAPKKDMPTGTFEATLCGIEDGSFLCEQTGAPVAYKMVKFKVGKVIHQVSLSTCSSPRLPPAPTRVSALRPSSRPATPSTSP